MTRERPASLVPLGRRFAVEANGLTFDGQPTFADWKAALAQLTMIRSAAQWAIGDLLLYADARGWPDGQVEDALSGLGLKRGTLHNLKSVAKAFPMAARAKDLPWSHHALVTSLGNEQQARLLKQSLDEHWGYDELRAQARAVRTATRPLRVWPEGQFPVQLSFCPWFEFGIQDGPTLTKDELCALSPKVQAMTPPDAVHYMRAPSAVVPDALDVLRAWGFTYRASAVQTLDVPRSQNWFRDRHVWLLIGTRGAQPPMPPESTWRDSVIDEKLTDYLAGEHGTLPKALLFGQPVDGWTSVGLVEDAPTRGIVLEAESVAVAS